MGCLVPVVCFQPISSFSSAKFSSVFPSRSITMKASIVCPSSSSANNNSNNNTILYTAFIEPRASATLGG